MDELSSEILLIIVIIAYIQLWFYTFKRREIEKKIEDRINERFDDFISKKILSMEKLANDYTKYLNKLTETKINEIQSNYDKFEESSRKISIYMVSLEDQLLKIKRYQENIAAAMNGTFLKAINEVEEKNELIRKNNDNIKRLEAMIEKRNKKIKRLEDGKNN